MKENIWYCKIGGTGCYLPGGADLPMRDAITNAFRDVAGVYPEFLFSGWGQSLTESERAVVENRAPSAEYYAKLRLEAAAPDLLAALERLWGASVGTSDEEISARLHARATIAKATE